MYIFPHIALLLGLITCGSEASVLPPSFDLPGHRQEGKRPRSSKYVPFDKLHTCPRLPARQPPKSAKDVRPDDFTVVMALGDSITAGLLARGSRDDATYSYHHQHSRSKPLNLAESSASESSSSARLATQDDRSQTPLIRTEEWWHPRLLPEVAEWRGLSYSIGMDEGAITIPNIIQHFAHANSDKSKKSKEVTGGSTGHHPPLTCLGDLTRTRGRDGSWRGYTCWPHAEEDGLNAALSGSVSVGLMSQVRDYLVPSIEQMDIKDEEWKYVNLGIGANDVCAFCLTPNVTELPLLGSPHQFASNIRNAVNELRKHAPNMIVNIVGIFKVSAIYELTLKDPYCQPPFLPLPVPHLPLECSCALLPGPGGDYTRARMDEMGRAYDEAVLEVVKEWEKEDDPSFGVVWQPGTSVDLENYPIEALSPIDCFHPSEAAHQRVAVGLWNRLTLSLKEKYTPIPWEETPLIRCLEEDDRIQVRSVTESSV